MAHWRGPAGYSRVPLIGSDSIENMLNWGDDPTVIIQPTLQPIGYIDDNFPSKFYDRPKHQFMSNPVQYGDRFPSVQTRTVPFSYQDNPAASQKRIVDIINQCRYLSSKQGMDKRELIDAIKRDEIEGRNYVETIGPDSLCRVDYVNPMGMEWSMYPPWTGPPSDYEKRIILQNNYSQGDHLPPPQFMDSIKPDASEFELKQRPPTRRTTARTSMNNRDDNTRSRSDECNLISDESDFDISETEEFISKMQIKKEAMDDHFDNCDYQALMSASDASILPIRKSGALNLASLIPKTPCNSSNQIEHQTLNSSYNQDISTYTFESSEEEDDDSDQSSTSDAEVIEYNKDPRDLLLKKRFEASRQASVSTVFGNLDLFDQMLTNSDKLMQQQTEEKDPSP